MRDLAVFIPVSHIGADAAGEVKLQLESIDLGFLTQKLIEELIDHVRVGAVGVDGAGSRDGRIASKGIHRIGQQGRSKQPAGQIIPASGDAEIIEAETVNQPELVRKIVSDPEICGFGDALRSGCTCVSEYTLGSPGNKAAKEFAKIRKISLCV